LAAAREKARRTSCLSNVKQMGAAFAAYTGDYSGYLPSWVGWFGPENTWCIDAGGNPASARSLDTKYTETDTVDSGTVDMGYHYEGTVSPIYVDLDSPGPTHDGSSWDYAYQDLQDALAELREASHG